MKDDLVYFLSDLEAVLASPEVIWNDWEQHLEVNVTWSLPQDDVDALEWNIKIQENLLLELQEVLELMLRLQRAHHLLWRESL